MSLREIESSRTSRCCCSGSFSTGHLAGMAQKWKPAREKKAVCGGSCWPALAYTSPSCDSASVEGVSGDICDG